LKNLKEIINIITPLNPLSRGDFGKHKKIKSIILFFLISILLVYLLIPLPSPLFNPDYSNIVLDTDGKILRVFLNKDEQWCFPPNPDLTIPEKLKTAVLFFEDKHFYIHPGVNPIALARAFSQNMKSDKIVSGGSTITMQVSRLLKPKSRTYFNKFLEILQALKIEVNYTKEEILRYYLDHAPYGSNIIGYQAASLRYFQKFPEQLTWSEAAILAVLPNAPGLISPVSNSNKLKQKRDQLLKDLKNKGVINQETYQLAVLESIPNMSIPFQMVAPHLTQFLVENQKNSSPILQTTIKKNIQIAVENLVKQHAGFTKNMGIFNASALVADTQTGKVRAYVGSQDFFDFKNQGQVNGILAPRSSGSILKPFLYALSMDEGILLPQTKVQDVPSFYGAFSPANASLKYNGMVSAQNALIRSLNVPAIRLLYTYGIQPFYTFLEKAGLSTLFRSADDYGLPLILGGAEITTWDAVKLFRGLANNGRFTSLQILVNNKRNEQHENSLPLISQEACYLTLNMLKELKRPGAEYYWQQYQSQWPIAWKTGTSYGQRDAWAVGVNPQWTIAVWVGNFKGEGNANLSGASCAGPLLFDIFNYLPKDPKKSWFKEPYEDLKLIEICSETGYLAGPDCEHKVLVQAPKQNKPLKICPYHKRVFVTNDEKYKVCSLCWETENHKPQSVLVYPPEAVQYLRERGQMISALPSHKPDCPSHTDNLALQIVYPQENSRLWVPRDFDGNLQKVTMRAAHREKDRTIFWYLDESYAGSSNKITTKALQLTKGWHVLEIIDEVGNRDKTRFYVDLKGN